MDPITGAFAAGHHAITLFKGIAEALKASGKSEQLSDLIDLQLTMSELIAKHQDLIFENGSLRMKVKELENSWKISEDVIREGNVLFLKSDAEKKRPFCMACWGYDHKLVDVNESVDRDGIERIHCNICDARRA